MLKFIIDNKCRLVSLIVNKSCFQPQLGIQLLNSSIIDGVLYCKVRRDVITLVNNRTFDLINDKYNLLVASGASVTGKCIVCIITLFIYTMTLKSLIEKCVAVAFLPFFNQECLSYAYLFRIFRVLPWNRLPSKWR